MKKSQLGFGCLAVALALAACAAPPEENIQAADQITLLSLNVEEGIKAGSPYIALTPYKEKGDVKIIVSCFLWSGEGPFCFRTEKDNAAKALRTVLLTRNAGNYRLEGFVKYSAGGEERESNRVSTRITVTPRG